MELVGSAQAWGLGRGRCWVGASLSSHPPPPVSGRQQHSTTRRPCPALPALLCHWGEGGSALEFPLRPLPSWSELWTGPSLAGVEDRSAMPRRAAHPHLGSLVALPAAPWPLLPPQLEGPRGEVGPFAPGLLRCRCCLAQPLSTLCGLRPPLARPSSGLGPLPEHRTTPATSEL